MVKRVLEECHAEVEKAASAREAVELLSRKQFHVLISDIAMPGQDGYDLIRKVRRLDHGNKDIPAIALTAFARSGDHGQATLAGFNTQVTKPVKVGELVGIVADFVGRIATHASSKRAAASI